MASLRTRLRQHSERPLLVEVLWEDHASSNGWGRHPEKEGALLVRSVGYLTRADRRYVNLTQSHSPINGCWSETLTIVRKALRSVRVLGRSRMPIREED